MQGRETLAVQKDEMDESTSADLAAEKCIIDHIKKKYPTHGIYSEEIGEIKGSESYRWVIDPLDQTKEYIRGLTEYNCLIAVEYEEKVISGVTLQHGIDTLYTGSKGNGVTCNGKPIHVSAQTNFSDAFIGFNLPNKKLDVKEIKDDLSILSTLIRSVYRVRPFWDQAKVMGWVARGILDGNIAPPHVFKWHDMASSIILIEEAGGKVTDWHGNPVTEKTNGNGVVASNGTFHDELLYLVQNIQ
jgi:myo-inositol-1(or 4)-monophosphatase